VGVEEPPKELDFTVTQRPEGGFAARSTNDAVLAQAATLEELQPATRAAILGRYPFIGDGSAPSVGYTWCRSTTV
jgi:hypothetical protein